MNTKVRVGLAALGILTIVGLLVQSAGTVPVKAGPASGSAREAGGAVLQEFTATVGEPFVPNKQPKPEPVNPDTSRDPNLDLPSLPPDPDKKPVDSAPPDRDRDYWTTPMTENFEGAFPTGLWNVFDNNGATYGEYYWDDDDFKPQPPSNWSAWVANGGANGVDPQYNNYANDMDTWMMYGPFDLSGCSAADFEFYYWNKSEANYDFFGWGASPNGSNVYGWQLSGSQESWNYVDFDLAPYLGDTSVWLTFIFSSDYTVTDIGTFVDDVTLWCLTETDVKSWTYMVYLDGDNNLESAAINDFMEMSSVGSSASVNIVALMDRISGYDTSYDDWTDTRRFYITNGLTPAAANGVSWGEANMGDPETLLKFVRWAKAAYPANHYALVFWDHGSGWRLRDPNDVLTKAVSFDDTSGGDAIDMPELRDSLSVLTNSGASPFDIVGMDACLMAMIEVDNQIKPYANIRVGSEENEPGDGWPYDTILSALVSNPAMSATTLATDIVDFYYSSYGNDNTQSAVNLGSPYTTLNTAVNNLATALINNGHNYISEIQTARNNSQQFAYTYYIDLWDFADWIRLNVPEPTINAAAIAVKDAVTAAVIREHHGASWPWARGISIYFPKTAGEYDARYDGGTGFLQFTGSTQWDEWIHKYHQFASYPAMFNKSSPASGVTGQLLSLNFSWAASAGATGYDICMFDTTNDNVCNGGGNWFDMGTGTSVAVGGLNENTSYYWQVRARNASGAVYANKGTWWSLTTGSLPTAFNKSGPANGATNQPLNPTITWGTSTGATSYEYCYDTTNDNACSGWTSNGSSTSKALSGLSQNTTYYWHVRALNTIGYRYSNGSTTAFWSFTTGGVPGAFNKSSPANGATSQPLSLTLSWGSSSNATSYEYCFDTNNNSSCDGSWVNTGTGTSAPINGLSLGTTYYWHIRALNSFGDTYSNGNVWWSFTTGNAPGAFSKSSPSDGAVNRPASLTLSWGSSSNASGYEYCYDTSNNNACDGSWVSIGANTSASINGLNLGTTYYWHARAINSFGTTYSNGNVWWSFTTGVPTPILTSPANGSNLLTNLPTFDWDNFPTAIGYNIQISRNNIFTLLVSNANLTGATNSSYTPTLALTANTNMWWRVRAKLTTTTYSGWSEVWSFTTANPPPAPTLVSPATNTLFTTSTVRLDWNNVIMPAGTVFQKYEVQMATNSAFSTNMTLTDAAISEYTFGPLTPNTLYYWRARAYNTLGHYGTWSASRTFRAAILPPTLATPPNTENVLTRRPTLTWNPVTGATGYTVEASTSSTFGMKAINATIATTTYTHTADLTANTLYYWHVKANGPNGPSLYSDVRTFTTGNPPSIPTLSAPTTNALVTTLRPKFDWSNSTIPAGVSFDHYQIQVSTSNSFASTLIDATTTIGDIANSDYTSTSIDLAPATTYYWRVRSWSAAGHYSGWSAIRSVRSAYAGPTLLLPVNGATGVALKPTFTWTPTAGATSYNLQVSKSNTFSLLVINRTLITPTYTHTLNLTAGTTYYWRVRVNGAFGPGMWSVTFSFTTP